MQKNKKVKVWLSVLGSLLVLALVVSWIVLCQTANKAPVASVMAVASPENEETKIYPCQISGITSLVLPSCVQTDRVVLYAEGGFPRFVRGSRGLALFQNGKPLNVKAICKKEDYKLRFFALPWDREPLYEVTLFFSENLPAVFLTSDDPQEHGRSWVEEDPFKNNKARGRILVQEPDGTKSYAGELTQIKGRGNSTWGFDKKPYQIKTAEKVDLLGSDSNQNKSKTWILLANYLDPVGLRNTLALSLGKALSMPANIEGKSVELYYDGEYRGMYMLTEKVEVASGRVDITDLEGQNEKANMGIDLSALPVATASTPNGAVFTYCKGMASPEDISGGYLLEMDYEVRALEEICYFKTKRNQYVVVKSPEYASFEEMCYIASLYQDFEDAVFSGGMHPRTDKAYSAYIDERSLACYYLVHEFSKSRDTFQSSAYLYKNAGENKLVMGPLWDHDMSFGKGGPDETMWADTPYGLATYQNEMCRALMSIEPFYALVKTIYENELVPILREQMPTDTLLSALSKAGAVNNRFWYAEESWQQEAEALAAFIEARQTAMSAYFSLYEDIYHLPKGSFYDVFAADPYAKSIEAVCREGILGSTGNGMFSPDSFVNRSQLVYAVSEIADPEAVTFAPLFSDVTSDMWFSEAAVWCGKNNWIAPDADGKLRPDAHVTKEEVADILYRFVGMPEASMKALEGYEDVSSVTKPEAVSWAIENGLLSAEEERIAPEAPVTMAELADILVYFCK